MTTINTSNDLLRLLEEDAQFYQAARRLILTNELLELPTRFNAFVDRVDGFITKQDQFNEEQREINAELRQFNQEQRQFNEEQRQFNEEQRQFNEEQLQFNQEQLQFNQEQLQFNQEQRQFNEEQRRFNQRIETSIGELKGNTARYVVAAHFGEIPELLGLEFQDSLSREQLRRLIGPVGRNTSSTSEWPELHTRRFGADHHQPRG